MAKRFGRHPALPLALALFALGLLASACSDTGDAGYTPPPLPGSIDGGADSGAPSDRDGGSDGSSSDAARADGGLVPCTTTFTFAPSGRAVTTVAVTGEWNAFAPSGVPLTGPDANGAYAASVKLAPGLVAYKLVIDGKLELDPASGLRKYVGGVENSAVRVADCLVPQLTLAKQTLTRAAAGQGRYQASVAYRDGASAAGIDPATVKATLRRDSAATPVQNATFDANAQTIAIDAAALADGKYTLFVDAVDRAGHNAKTLRLVFWIEAAPFDWHDAVIYMAMTDRFEDGDPQSNAPPTAGVDPRADYHGGDLQGITARIKDGTFDKLGVRALWLSPFHVNPAGAYAADDGVHQVTGYHGYWPIKARGVEPRIGGDAALKAMVSEAHAHGIRVLQDFVVNHVHESHEYFKAHPSWFRTGCVCGTNNCDWTAHRLDCLFSSYLPDVDWTVPEVSEQFGDDAVWWIDAFDLDGLRIDAVKHVEDACIMNLSSRIRDELEASGTRVFLTGETAMGWSDCGLACNADQYGTISRYIGPHGLDGQFDFVLYHGVSYRTFAYDQKGLIHADYWAQASGWEYPQGAIMTPYIGSHDTARFATLATYRGQDASHDIGVPGNKWTNAAGPPTDGEPYARQRVALSWLMGLPGAPLLYYGDEYGEWGGSDPNNRVMWRGAGALSADEQATLTQTRALGAARRELVALRRGAYKPLFASEDVLAFARQTAAGDVAIVALTRAPAPQTVTFTIPPTMPLAAGTRLRDRLGGADVTVSSGALTLTLGARGAAILAP
jgi:glycosidase